MEGYAVIQAHLATAGRPRRRGLAITGQRVGTRIGFLELGSGVPESMPRAVSAES